MCEAVVLPFWVVGVDAHCVVSVLLLLLLLLCCCFMFVGGRLCWVWCWKLEVGDGWECFDVYYFGC